MLPFHIPDGVTAEEHVTHILSTEDARLRRFTRLERDADAMDVAGKILLYTRLLAQLQAP